MKLQRSNTSISFADASILLLVVHLLLPLCQLQLLVIWVPSHLAKMELRVNFSLGDETPASFFVGNILKQTPRMVFGSKTVTDIGISNSPKMSATLLDSTRGLASRLLHLSDMGDLYTINTIDRDDAANICGPLECCARSQCNLTFTAAFVHADTPNVPFKVVVTVYLIDTNDNPPTFHDQQFSITIPETTSFDFIKSSAITVGEYSLPRASDKDSRQNGVKKYQLDGHPDYFTLTSSKSECYPCLRVSTLTALDYENSRHRKFTVELIAFDGGAIPRSGSITINIFLADLNDNAPVFTQSSETIRVIENYAYNQAAIYTFRATDADSGANGRVQYAFKSQQHSTEGKNKFDLNSKTGELFLQSTLNYELYSERKIVLEILALDSGRPALTSSFSLTIEVIDINDNSPKIVIQRNYTIMENSKANQPALQLLITDADEVSQGQIECRLENPEDFPLRLEGHLFFTVWTTRDLDYEEMPFINFNLICLDNAEPPLNTTWPLTIKVGNLNDNAPVFRSSENMPISTIELTLDEDEELLRPVYVPTVIDADGDSVSFRIKSVKKDSPFMVILDTGAIYLKTPLDYETSKCHDFEILVIDASETDLKEPALTSTLKVRVQVQDVNDNAPELMTSSIIPVKPDTPAGYMISQVTFKDADRDGLQEISTKLIAQETFPKSREEKYFALKENGALFTLLPLSKEDLSVIALSVVATDIDNGNRLSSTVTLAVVIENLGNADTMKVVRPFPGSTITWPVKKNPNHSLRSENLQEISLPIEVYDSTKSSKLVFTIDRQCNGSEFFRIDRNDTLTVRSVLNELTLGKLGNIPSGSKLKIKLQVSDDKKPNRKVESDFFIQFDWALKMSGYALWPADAAEADANSQNDVRVDDSWLTDTNSARIDDRSGEKPFKLSLSSVIIFLLILVFSLAIGFALFAAVIWARVKRAASNAAVAATAARGRQSSILAASISSDKTTKHSPRRSSIWQLGNTNSPIASERIQLASTSEEPRPEVHYAWLISNGDTVLGDLGKTPTASGTSEGPHMAYFDLLVPPSGESHSAVKQNFPDLTSVVSAASSASLNTEISPTPPVNCYLIV